MAALTIKEATSLIHSYGLKCDEVKVTEWVSDGKIKGFENKIEEDDVYNFLEAYRWEGTAYEKGIDNKTKISRLLEEIADLKNQVSELQEEKAKLEDRLGISPF